MPDRDPPRLELLDVRTPDRIGALLVELVGIDPSHVVRLEHLRIEHALMLLVNARGRLGAALSQTFADLSYGQTFTSTAVAVAVAMSPWLPPRLHDAFFHSWTISAWLALS